MHERKLRLRYLRRFYGYDLMVTEACEEFGQHCQTIPSLQASSQPEGSDNPLASFHQRSECLKHPFYQALAHYLVACECLEKCGHPPEELPLVAEAMPFVKIKTEVHLKSLLLNEMRQRPSLHGETRGEYRSRTQISYRSEQLRSEFHMVYMPVFKLFDPESGPDGDTEFFYGALAYIGISLKVASRLKRALKQFERSSYEALWNLIPGVIETQILPYLQSIDDPNKKLAEFERLPGKTAYALEKVLGATKKSKQAASAQAHKKVTVTSLQSLEDVAMREQVTAHQSKPPTVYIGLDRLTKRQREVFTLNKVQGLTLEEIASKLRIAPGTAGSHLARAKRKLEQIKNKTNF